MRKPGRKILAAAAGSLLLLIGAYVLWCRAEGARRWAAMDARVRELHRAELARPSDRPVLWGEPLPGDAWDDYERAVTLLGVIRWSDPSWKAASEFLEGKPEADRSAVLALLAERRASLDAIRLGARRSSARVVLPAIDGPILPYSALTPVTALSQIMACEARVLGEKGQATEAVDVALAQAQFARDVGTGSGMFRRFRPTFLDPALEELRRVVVSGRLASSDLLELGAALDLLDRGLSETPGPDPMEVMDLGLEFLRSENLFQDLRAARCMCAEHRCPPWGGWRFGFSDRLMAALAFEEADRMSADAPRSCTWSEARRFNEGSIEKVTGSGNPLMRSHVAELLGSGRQGRETHARLRLLRFVALYLATGELPALEDPFGTRLFHQSAGATLKVWSVGTDGVDDGGVGVWKPSRERDKDVVLELPR